MSSTFKTCLKYAKIIKSISDIKIVWGGIHPTLAKEETIELPEVDYICIGEGEVTMVELINKLDKKQEPDVKGIWYKKNGRIVRNGKRLFTSDLNSLPYPEWDFWNVQNYFKKQVPMPYSLPVIASRGCPYECTFCSVKPLSESNLGTYFRLRSPEKIIEEIEINRKKYPGLKAINFRDCTFGLNKKHFYELTKLLKKNKIKWKCQTRPEIISENWIKSASAAGCIEVSFGYETITRSKEFKRNQNILHFKNAVMNLRKYGMLVSINIIIGGPDESYEDSLYNLKVARKLSPDFRTLGILTPFPKTFIYDKNKKYKRNCYILPTKKRYFANDKFERLIIIDDLLHYTKLFFREFNNHGLVFIKNLLLSLRNFISNITNITSIDKILNEQIGRILIVAVFLRKLEEKF